MQRYRLCSLPARARSVDHTVGNARHRGEERVSVYTVAALISAEELPFPLPCTVRDISKTGARLEVDREDMRARPRRDLQLPRSLSVYFCPSKIAITCWLSLQDGNHFGVEFIGEVSAEICPSC